LVRRRQLFNVSFEGDGAQKFTAKTENLPQKLRNAPLNQYFMNLFTATEQIFARRFNEGYEQKQRPWAMVRDTFLGRMVRIGNIPLVRTGLLMGSLAGVNSYSIRDIGSRSARFGTKRMAMNTAGRTYDLLSILSYGSGGGGTERIRYPGQFGSLSWEAGPGFRVSTKNATRDSGARIPPRPISLDARPMSSEELTMLNNMASKFWRDYIASIGMAFGGGS